MVSNKSVSLQPYNFKHKNMATPIRIIPTLQGEDAERFIERSEWAEAHPGRDAKVSSEEIQFLRNYLREQHLA